MVKLIKKLLFIITFVLCFSFINVQAENVNTNLYPNLVMPTGVEFYGWSSATDYYELGTAYLSGDEDASGNKYTYYYTSSNAYNDVNGFSIYFDLPGTIPKNTNISMDLVFCNTNSNNYFNGGRTYGIGTAPGSTLGDNYSPTNSYWYSLGTLNTAANNFTCRRFSINFTTPVGGTRFAFRIKSTSTISLGTLAFMGIASSNYGFDYSNQFENIDSGIGDMVDQQEQTNDKLDDTNDKLDDTNEKLDELENTIKDNNVDNPNFEEFEDYLADNGVITQLITLPVQLYTKILNGINGSCNTFNLGNLWGSDLSLPCIEPQKYLGNTLWNTIDVLFSGFFIYVISKKMINVFEQFTNLKEGDILD